MKRYAAVGLSFVLALFSAGSFGGESLREAESTAVAYMSAFFRGDIEVAASLTHHDALAQAKAGIVAEFEKANPDTALVQLFGDKTTAAEVRAMEPIAVYIQAVSANQMRPTEDARAALAKTSVSAAGSSFAGTGRARVTLALSMPTKTGPNKQNTVLVLRTSMGAWKVTNEN